MDQPPDDVPSAESTLDESPPWTDRIRFQLNQIKLWYHAQSHDTKMLFKVLLTILVLYVLFGGGFGIFGTNRQQRGNYEAGNAYDQYSRGGYNSNNDYYQRRNMQQQQQQQRRTSYSDDYYGEYTRPRNNRHYGGGGRRRSFGMFDGSGIMTVLGLGVVMLVSHQFGINPFQVLWMFLMMNRGGGGMYYGGGRRFRRRGWY